MEMKKKMMACFLVCTLMFQMSVFPVSAETSTDDNNGYLYQQDFSCTTEDLTTEGWNGNLKYFDINSDGMLEAKSGTTTDVYIFLNNNTETMTWSDYIFEADVVMTSTRINGNEAVAQNWASIFVGSQNPVIKTGNSSGYELRLFTKDNTSYQLDLIDRNNTNAKTVSSDSLSDIKVGNKCTLKMEVNGNSIKGYVNGECLVEMTVSGVDNITGTVGLRAKENISRFDNLAVYKTENNYSEDFSGTTDDLTADGWNSNQIAKFAISEGMLKASKQSSGDSVYVFMNRNTDATSWSNYTFETDVVMTTGVISDSFGKSGKWAGIFVGSQSANITNTNPNGYELRLFTTDDVNYKLCLSDQNATDMPEVSSEIISGIEAGTKCRLKLEVSGNYLKGYLNDNCLVEMKVDGVTDLVGYIGLRAQGRISSFDNISVKSLDYLYDVSFYRNGIEDVKLQPYKEGYVFGGWYKDMAFKTPLGTEVTTGKTYAKFLDKSVLSVKAQLDATTLAASDTGTTKMRFVTTVDNLDYQKVGFTVSTPKKTADFESTTAYKNIVAKDSNTAISYSPSNFSSDSDYFITIILNNLSITEADLEKIFTVTPWWVTADGTTVTGVTRGDITIQKGIETNLENQNSTQ